jgi:hypothetical protein
VRNEDRPSSSRPQLLERDALLLGSTIGEGGLGRVYRVESSPSFDLPWPLVFKEYRDKQSLATSSIAGIVKARWRLTPLERSQLDASTAWPVSIVTAEGKVAGCLMPLIDDDFFQDVRLLDTVKRVPRESGYLFSGSSDVNRLVGVDPRSWDLKFRVSICYDLSRILTLLHDLEIIFGDISARNTLFSVHPSPRVFLIDCDGARLAGNALPGQAHTVGWLPPGSSEATGASRYIQTYRTDDYKLALFVLRCIAPGRGSTLATDWQRASGVLDDVGTSLLRRSLMRESFGSVPAREWMDYLGDVLTRGVQAAPRGSITKPSQRPSSSYQPPLSAVTRDTMPSASSQHVFLLGEFLGSNSEEPQMVGLPVNLVRQNVAIVGPARSGKSHLVASWIEPALRSGFSVVHLGLKEDFRRPNSAWSESQFVNSGLRMKTLDSNRPDLSLRWNWLASARDEPSIDGVVDAILGRQEGKSVEYFHQTERSALRELIRLSKVLYGDRGRPHSLVHLIENQQTLIRLLDRIGGGFPTLATLIKLAERDYTQLLGRLQAVLLRVAGPTMDWITDNANFEMKNLSTSAMLVTLSASLAHGDRSNTLASLFLNELINDRFRTEHSTHRRAVIVILDEVSAVGDCLDLRQLISGNATSGIATIITAKSGSHLTSIIDGADVLRQSGVFIGMGYSGRELGEALGSRLAQYGGSTDTADSVSRRKASSILDGMRALLPVTEKATDRSRLAIVHVPLITPDPFLVALATD